MAPLDSNDFNSAVIQTSTQRQEDAHSYTHTHVHTHKQDTFLVLFTTTSTSGKRGIKMVWTGADYWLRGAESHSSDEGNSWIQKREGQLGSQLLVREQWDDQHTETELCTRCPLVIRPLRPSVFLWLVTSGDTAVHLMAFHLIITVTVSTIYIL